MGLVHVVAFSMLPRQNPKGVRVNVVMSESCNAIFEVPFLNITFQNFYVRFSSLTCIGWAHLLGKGAGKIHAAMRGRTANGSAMSTCAIDAPIHF